MRLGLISPGSSLAGSCAQRARVQPASGPTLAAALTRPALILYFRALCCWIDGPLQLLVSVCSPCAGLIVPHNLLSFLQGPGVTLDARALALAFSKLRYRACGGRSCARWTRAWLPASRSWRRYAAGNERWTHIRILMS